MISLACSRPSDVRQPAQECHHAPDGVIVHASAPRRHTGGLEAVLDDPEIAGRGSVKPRIGQRRLLQIRGRDAGDRSRTSLRSYRRPAGATRHPAKSGTSRLTARYHYRPLTTDIEKVWYHAAARIILDSEPNQYRDMTSSSHQHRQQRYYERFHRQFPVRTRKRFSLLWTFPEETSPSRALQLPPWHRLSQASRNG